MNLFSQMREHLFVLPCIANTTVKTRRLVRGKRSISGDEEERRHTGYASKSPLSSSFLVVKTNRPGPIKRNSIGLATAIDCAAAVSHRQRPAHLRPDPGSRASPSLRGGISRRTLSQDEGVNARFFGTTPVSPRQELNVPLHSRTIRS